jgi:DNA-binding transcriptional MerR regulator
MDTTLAADLQSSRREEPEAGDWTSCALDATAKLPMPESHDAAENCYTIGELAREFGVTSKAIRFYEDRGLLTSRGFGHSPGYGARERLRLKMILKGTELGFTLAELRDILNTHEHNGELPEHEADDGLKVDHAQIGMPTNRHTHLFDGKLDLACAFAPEQIVAQIEHLERQRKALDAALDVLRDAHQRMVAGRGRRRGC